MSPTIPRNRQTATHPRRWLAATCAAATLAAPLFAVSTSVPTAAQAPAEKVDTPQAAAAKAKVAAAKVAAAKAEPAKAEATREPRPVPLTRPEMKQRLEEIKQRTPRVPLPELTDAERVALAERGVTYENRLRYHYLPALPPALAGSWRWSGSGFAGGSRDADPDMRLDYAFKTRLFWIVSRTNNCQYCLGHQESKLLAAGMGEDQIAALDSEWTLFPAREQAAFAYSRKLTYSPQSLNDADFAALAPHFTPLEILEMTLSIAGNNAINRWKEGAGVPQSSDGGNFGRTGSNPPTAPRPPTDHSYLTPTSNKYAARLSRVAPIANDPRTGSPTTRAVFRREALESRAVVEQALLAAASRQPRLPLADDKAARDVLPPEWKADSAPLPGWVRLLASFPRSAPTRILAVRMLETGGDLPAALKAKTAWILARQDRAWYALGEARAALHREGLTDDAIFAIDETATPAERSLFQVARNLAASPVVLTDNDVADAVKLAGPRIVTQFIQYVTHRASFQRVTEAAKLPIEESWMC
jgi:AhpD family alkylhydroperoxidase